MTRNKRLLRLICLEHVYACMVSMSLHVSGCTSIQVSMCVHLYFEAGGQYQVWSLIVLYLLRQAFLLYLNLANLASLTSQLPLGIPRFSLSTTGIADGLSHYQEFIQVLGIHILCLENIKVEISVVLKSEYLLRRTKLGKITQSFVFLYMQDWIEPTLRKQPGAGELSVLC